MRLFGSEPQNLFKHCSLEFNVAKGCNTIRLGTLWGYRKEEDELLKDEGEGKFDVSLQFPELTQVSQGWFSEIDDGTSSTVQIDQAMFTGAGVAIKGITFNKSEYNAWIFCTSFGDAGVGSVTQTHDSAWLIRGETVNEFGNYLSQLLLANIQADDLPPHLVKQYSLRDFQTRLGIQFEARSIEYGNRTIEIGSETDFPIEKLRELRASIPFTKPERFSDEREFRFIFWLTFDNARISVPDKAKILNLRAVDRMISAMEP